MAVETQAEFLLYRLTTETQDHQRGLNNLFLQFQASNDFIIQNQAPEVESVQGWGGDKTKMQVGSVLSNPRERDLPLSRNQDRKNFVNSLRGGTRILLLIAHQPMGWTSTVPRLHQKSWVASFSKPSYRSSTRYPETKDKGACERGWDRKAMFSGLLYSLA
jgi:hypothetical protein